MPLTGDLAYCINVLRGEVRGMIGVHVDDSCGAGDETFVKASKLTSQRSDFKEKVYNQRKFAGITFKK